MINRGKIEEYNEAGIVVRRGAIEPTLIVDALEEAKTVHERAASSGGLRLDKGRGSKYPIHQSDQTLFWLRDAGLTAIKTLLETWRPDGYPIATVNRQPPRSFQAFHQDGVIGSPAIAHLSGCGMFDYILPTPQFLSGCNAPGYSDYQSIEVAAGDVVELCCPTLVHRGRNPSDSERFNIGLYDAGEIE